MDKTRRIAWIYTSEEPNPAPPHYVPHVLHAVPAPINQRDRPAALCGHAPVWYTLTGWQAGPAGQDMELCAECVKRVGNSPQPST